MSDEQLVRQLLDKAFDSLADDKPLTESLSLSIRIAELRRDHVNLWWLRKEAIGVENPRARVKLETEMRQHFPVDQFERLRLEQQEDLIERRRVSMPDTEGDERVWGLSVAELEKNVESIEDVLRAHEPPAGMHPQDLYFVRDEYLKLRTTASPSLTALKAVRERIRERIQSFLAATEAAITFARSASNAFERVRILVDGKLALIAPDVLRQLQAAYRRAAEEDSEARAHALTSCRRVLESLADVVFPATGELVEGPDGSRREMSDDKYVNRLWQFMSERALNATSRRLVQATAIELGRRLDEVYDLSSKGVHADVTAEEVDQCVLQTYLLAGDVLRLYEGRDNVASAAPSK